MIAGLKLIEPNFILIFLFVNICPKKFNPVLRFNKKKGF